MINTKPESTENMANDPTNDNLEQNPTETSVSVEALKTSLKSDSSYQTDNEKTKSPKEIGGRGGLEPTRYGDWEKNGRCIDF